MQKEVGPGVIVAVVLVVLVIVGIVGYKVMAKPSTNATGINPESDPRYTAHEKNGQNYMQRPENVRPMGSPSHPGP